MSEEFKVVLRSFYSTLTSRDFEKMLSLCDEDVTLNWAHFTFEGREKVRTWAKGLRQMFPRMRILGHKFVAYESRATHKLLIEFVGQGGRRGALPCDGSYEFRNGKIHNISISLSWGFLTFSSEEAEDLGIEKPMG